MQYFDSRLLIEKRGNSKLQEKVMSFNGSFLSVPLKGFKKFVVELSIDPTKLDSLDFNKLEEATEAKPENPLASSETPNLVSFLI